MKKNHLIVSLLVVAIFAVLVVKNKQAAEPRSDPATTVPVALPRLLDLGADKCVPCKMMAPILAELEETYASRLTVEFIDVWKNQQAGQDYKIRMIPTQLFFDSNGNELFRHEGFFSKEDILVKWNELGIDLSNE